MARQPDEDYHSGLLTNCRQEMTRMNVQWWREFKAALCHTEGSGLSQVVTKTSTCPVCLENQPPETLRGPLRSAVFSINSAKKLCRHEVCKDCFKAMSQHKMFRCPFCRADWTALFWGVVNWE